jgi:hypothetical protein
MATPEEPTAAPDVTEPAEPAAPPSIDDVIAQVVAAGAETPEPVEAPAEAPAEAPPEPAKEAAPADEVRKARAILAAAKKLQAESEGKVTKSRAELIAAFRADPGKFLAEAGMSVEQFLGGVAGADPAEPAAKSLEEQVAELRKQISDSQKAASDREAMAAADAARERIVAGVKAEPDKFPLINRGGAHALVPKLMVSYYKRFGKPLDAGAAAAEVESWLSNLAGPAKAPVAPAKTAAPTRTPSTSLGALPPRESPPSEADTVLDPDERMALVMKQVSQLPTN